MMLTLNLRFKLLSNLFLQENQILTDNKKAKRKRKVMTQKKQKELQIAKLQLQRNSERFK